MSGMDVWRQSSLYVDELCAQKSTQFLSCRGTYKFSSRKSKPVMSRLSVKPPCKQPWLCHTMLRQGMVLAALSGDHTCTLPSSSTTPKPISRILLRLWLRAAGPARLLGSGLPTEPGSLPACAGLTAALPQGAASSPLLPAAAAVVQPSAAKPKVDVSVLNACPSLPFRLSDLGREKLGSGGRPRLLRMCSSLQGRWQQPFSTPFKASLTPLVKTLFMPSPAEKGSAPSAKAGSTA